MRRVRPALLALALATLVAGTQSACGDKSIEQRKAEDQARIDARFAHLPAEQRPITEAEKIERLIELVRESGHTFIRNGQEHTSQEAAEHLAMKLERAGDRVHTAEDFIAGIATRSSMSGQLYRLRTADGTEYATRDWLAAHLGTIEKTTRTPPPDSGDGGLIPPPPSYAGPNPSGAPAPAPTVIPTIDVDYALNVIEQSGLSFLAPHEDRDPTTYTAGEFARMLRRKSQWLGPDLDALEPWLDEIASRSFKTDLPYQVRLQSGELVELRPWLDEQLARARQGTLAPSDAGAKAGAG